MKYNKQVFYILLGVVILLIFIVNIYLITFIQPKIIFIAQINKVNDEDYKRIMDNVQIMSSDKGIENFRHIDIEIKVIPPLGLINHIKIDRDILQQYLKQNDKIQILGGGFFEHGNGMEYAENIEIYLNGITDNELRDILRDFKYKVKWQSVWNSYNDKIFYFRDYLKLYQK